MIEIGNFILDDKLKTGIRVKIDKNGKETGVFIIKNINNFLYIGGANAPKTTLETRLKRLASTVGGGTNERISGEIKKYLVDGKEVDIYVKKCSNINGKEIKKELIKTYNPIWNIVYK